MYTSLNGSGLTNEHQDCTIAFFRNIAETSYGFIKYFIQIDSEIVAFVQNLEFKRALEIDSKINSHLKEFFFISKLANNFSIIPLSQIKCKCTVILNPNKEEIFLSHSTDINTHS